MKIEFDIGDFKKFVVPVLTGGASFGLLFVSWLAANQTVQGSAVGFFWGCIMIGFGLAGLIVAGRTLVLLAACIGDGL